MNRRQFLKSTSALVVTAAFPAMLLQKATAAGIDLAAGLDQTVLTHATMGDGEIWGFRYFIRDGDIDRITAQPIKWTDVVVPPVRMAT
jgi:hypothetical protein